MFRSLNIDEIMYRIHLYFLDPIWGFITFRWVRESGSAKLYENQGDLGIPQDAGFFDSFFSSGLFRIFNSRPSNTPNSVEELINPSADRGVFESLMNILFGRSDKESVIELLFTTPFGLLAIAALLSFLAYMFAKQRMGFLSKKENIMYDIAHASDLHVSSTQTNQSSNNKADRWRAITKKLESESEDMWKIAIMDADILLGEVLDEQGFDGSTIAEKLQSAATLHKDIIQYVWDAHKVRNAVAHEAAMALTNREAQLAISNYERFFQALY